MLKFKNMMMMICLVIFAGVSVNAMAGPSEQMTEQAGIVKAVQQTGFETANANTDLPAIGDVVTDVIIGEEVSADDVGNMLTKVQNVRNLPVCPRCRIKKTSRFCSGRGVNKRCSGSCRANGKKFNCTVYPHKLVT